MKEKGSRGQWKWIPTCPLVTRDGKHDGFKPLHDYLTKYQPYLAKLGGIDTARKEDAVFLNSDGGPLAYWGVAALWRRLRKRTGIVGKHVSATMHGGIWQRLS